GSPSFGRPVAAATCRSPPRIGLACSANARQTPEIESAPGRPAYLRGGPPAWRESLRMRARNEPNHRGSFICLEANGGGPLRDGVLAGTVRLPTGRAFVDIVADSEELPIVVRPFFAFTRGGCRQDRRGDETGAANGILGVAEDGRAGGSAGDAIRPGPRGCLL